MCKGGADMIEKKSTRAGKIAVYFFLTLWALIVLFPFYWMILTSLKGYGAYNSEYIPKFFTLNPTLKNYTDAFTTVPLAKYVAKLSNHAIKETTKRSALIYSR